ncbi:MAG TPA: hypothetical protein VM489_03660, partial [Burkholderiales bacterium]|nr:hypothetical protein [Burkholderiales bacterium]
MSRPSRNALLPLGIAAALLGLGAAGVALPEAPALPAGLEQHELYIPAGQGRHALALRVVRPRGAGPYGAIVLNHGFPVAPRERVALSADHLLPAAVALAQRGYAVFIPLRRGFG